MLQNSRKVSVAILEPTIAGGAPAAPGATCPALRWISGHMQLSDPPLPVILARNKGGGSLSWYKLDFFKSYFLSELKQRFGPEKLCKRPSKKISPLRGDFYSKNTVKNFAASRRFLPQKHCKKFRRFAAILP